MIALRDRFRAFLNVVLPMEFTMDGTVSSQWNFHLILLYLHTYVYWYYVENHYGRIGFSVYFACHIIISKYIFCVSTDQKGINLVVHLVYHFYGINFILCLTKNLNY